MIKITINHILLQGRADWETQKLYSNYEVRYSDIENIEDFILHSGALGLLPVRRAGVGTYTLGLSMLFQYNEDKKIKK